MRACCCTCACTTHVARVDVALVEGDDLGGDRQLRLAMLRRALCHSCSELAASIAPALPAASVRASVIGTTAIATLASWGCSVPQFLVVVALEIGQKAADGIESGARDAVRGAGTRQKGAGQRQVVGGRGGR